MKSGVPWSIRGIDDDIRDAARAAARRSGLSVSEWLNDLIAKQAAAEGIAPARSRHEDDDVDGDAEADAVADAVQRLTRRIRAMDDNSRATLSGLQDRLDEIEMRLETVAVSRGRGTERARSLKGVATIVDELSREIDNADENARSMIEGLRARGAAKAPQREIGIDRVAEAIRGLDERISSMSDRIKSPAVEEPAAGLDTIKARLDSLLAQSPEKPSGRAAALDATLRSLETHIDQAKSRLAAAARRPSPRSAPPVSMTSDDEDRIRRIESHLAEITGGIAARRGATRPAGRGGDFVSAVAEISARQRSIDDVADYASLARDQRHVVDSLAALRADISALADGMVSFGRGDADDKEAYFGLARRIDALASERPLDRDDLSRMRADLEAVRATLDGGAGLARLDTVGEEIAAIRRALEADDSPRAIARLEMRVAELGRGMEAALNATNAASRRGGGTDAVSRLEMRLDAIAARIDDFLGRAAPADAISGLQERFAKLADRLERVSVARQEPPAVLDEIKSEIAAIRRDISGRAVPKVDHLEEQIADLASRLDSATRSESEGQALAELEAQVAHMASELERSMPRTATLKQVEENLARLQGFLSDNRQESVEDARAAARDAVREIAGSPGDSDLVRALKGDLENIRAAAGDADHRTQETLGSVHETLARVVDRLTRLEQDTDETGSEMAREPAKATGTYGAEAPIPRAESGSAGSRAGLARLPEDNRPLEPGSGKPDLAALRELARSASEAQRDKKGDRKADFIAAARRAAQAAATEAASDVVEEEEGDDGKPGAFARIGQAIRKRRRPLLLAAAALVLAISALHLFGERGIKSVELSPDTAAIDQTVGDIPAGPLASDTFAVEAPTTPTVPQVSKSALVAPPPDGSSIAFAEPEGFDSRFGDVPATPPPSGFTPPPAPAPTGATMAALDATPSAPPETSAMSETASATGSAIGPQKLREAAAAGDPAAAFEVAARYAEGNGVQPDLAKAAEWYRRAADAGIAVAQYRLGSLYERGQGVARDLATAVTWYQRAADQGNVGAMHNLAVMMSEGVDGAPDHAKAFDWFLAAANCGVKDSQYNLGVIYARGLGPGQNLVESYKWFAVAAAGGDADATLRRDEVAKVLSPDDLAKARAAVQAWRAKPVISEANTVATPAGGWQGPSGGVTEADRRALVKKIQTLLAEQGYDPGPLDGFEGPKTQEAVKAFQRKIGESETGQISGDLVAALASPPT